MDELYIVAREVLLDALEALGSHREAVILVGAQAIYLRVGEAADLAVAPYTTDGDLAIDPQLLTAIPPLEQGLRQAGFELVGNNVGIWTTHRPTAQSPETPVEVDLLVPSSISPGTGRSAKLSGHDPLAARNVTGLEGAVVDFDLLAVATFQADGHRRFEIKVAGPAALLVAKLYKIQERKGTRRQEAKDALDVLRLLRGISVDELARRMRVLLAEDRSTAVAMKAKDLLGSLFGSRAAPGSQMAADAAGILASRDEITISCEALANALLTTLDGK